MLSRRTGFLLLALSVGALSAAPDHDASRVSAGDFTVAATERGFVILYRGETVCLGSYVNGFRPGYKGTLVSSGEGWKTGTVSRSEEGRTITLQAAFPEGTLTYSAMVSEAGVRVTARVSLAEGAAVGPVEYAAFQLPPSLTERATVEVVNAAGMVTDSLPVPSVGKRGAMAGSGEALVFKTPAMNLTVSSASPLGLYPFDARVAQYGTQQGLWAFGSIPLTPGRESASVVELQVAPPDPTPVVGTITLAPGVRATAVATVADPTARERLAADEIAAYLKRITGKELTRTEVAGEVVLEGVIAVGTLATDAGLIAPDELKKVRPDGYVVRAAAGRVAVCGWRDLGTVYGAYALLQHLGVRFYAPGCEVVPTVRDLTLEPFELGAKPAYELRVVTGDLKLGHTPSADLGNPREIGEAGNVVHSAEYLAPYEKYGETPPEYFALQKDGQRLHHRPNETRFDVHLCLSNPEVRALSAERLLALIEKQKDRTFFGVSQGDGFAWCECKACKALDAVPGVDMTDRLLDYVNVVAREVAVKYPDKRILTLAYTNATSPPPTKVLPEANVRVQYCPYPRRTNCQSHDFTCEQNQQGFADLTGWIAKCPDNLYIFDYSRGYKIWYEPFGSFYAMKRKLDLYAAHGIRGLYYCGVPTNFRDLFVFVQSKLQWAPKADAEALIDEFMAAYYGKAAAPVRAYFDFLHRQVEERHVHQMCEGANPGLVSAEYADTALELFAKAEAAAAGDRPSLYRVRAEKFCVLYADLNERNPVQANLAVGKDTFARRLAEFLQLGRTMRIGSLGRRDDGPVSDWLYKVARIRTQTNPWYADPLVDRLLDDPAGTLAAEEQLGAQTKTAGGWLVLLDGFRGCLGPQEYSNDCPPRRAVWIYGKNTKTPAMWAQLHLDSAPTRQARLVLTAQDDDKPGAVELFVTLNGREVFRGPNPFKERGWSTTEFPLPAGVLRQGENEIRFATLADSVAPDAGWFMMAECKVLFE